MRGGGAEHFSRQTQGEVRTSLHELGRYPIRIWFDSARWLPYYPIRTSETKNFLARGGCLHNVGAWLSLVERTVRDREVGGSNPLAPTNQQQTHELFKVAKVGGLKFCLCPNCGQRICSLREEKRLAEKGPCENGLKFVKRDLLKVENAGLITGRNRGSGSREVE